MPPAESAARPRAGSRRTEPRSRCSRAARPGSRATAKEVEERGGKALVLPTDVADPDQVEAAAQAAESELGPIDIWINDAMATIYAEFLDVEPDEYRRATDVTYHGMVWGTRAALRRMSERNRGTIVQVGSALAFRGIPLQAPYCGAKHACKGFTESVITEIKHHGWDIHVTMVHLPGVNTTQFTWGRTKLPKQTQPVPPIYQPEIAADAIHWAAYHKRRQIYVGVPTVLNVLGESVAPWFLDWYLAKTGYSGQMTKQAARRRPGPRQPLPSGRRRRGSRRARAVRRAGARAQLPDEPHEAPPARRLGRSRSRRGRDRRRAPPEALARTL